MHHLSLHRVRSRNFTQETLGTIHKERLYLKLSINLLVVYRESVNLIGYISRRLSADSLQL